MVDAAGESAQETHIVDPLVAQVAGIEVEPEPPMPIQRCQGALAAGDVEGDLGGMDFQREIDPGLVEPLENGGPAGGEVGETAIPECLGGGWERIQRMLNRRAGEAGNRLHPEPCGGAGGILHLPRGALAHSFRIAVAPDVGRQDGLVPLVDPVAHRLAD